MRWCICGLVALGCSSPHASEPDGALDGSASDLGTLAYVESGTQHLRLLDVGSGVSRLIDPGRFASVSIAPDAQHVAYGGEDQVLKFSDTVGSVTQLTEGSGGEQWFGPTTLVYSISDAIGHHGTMVLSSLDAAPRFEDDGYGIAISPDATLDGYVNPRGDVIIEAIDGTGSRVLLPSTDPTAVNPTVGVGGFTPDQRAVLVYDRDPVRMRIVSLADASWIAVDDVYGNGGFLGPTFMGASPFSPDGSELLQQRSDALVAVDLATGSTRTIVPLGGIVSAAGAVFIDADRVLWARKEDHSQGDLGMYELSLHVTGPDPGDDRVLDSGSGGWATVAVSPEGFVALPGNAVLVGLDGTVLATNDLTSSSTAVVDILGLTPDHRGVVTRTLAGDIRIVRTDGSVQDVVKTAATGLSESYTTARF